MYKDFYGFSDEPFKPIANPHFLFLTEPLRKNLLAVASAIQAGERIITLTGEVGVGKTTFMYALLRELDPTISAAFITHPNLNFEDLVAAILESLTGPGKKKRPSAPLQAFPSFLKGKAIRGEKVVIVIDEAQTLAPGVLAGLLGLGDMETGPFNPLQMIFVGQPEFDDLLDRDDTAQRKRAIQVRCRIQPLTQKESERYIEEHLNRIGARSAEVLTPEAIFLIRRYSGGIPRVINILCDNAFWFGCQRSKKRIDATVIGEAIGVTYLGRQRLSHVWTFAKAFLYAHTLFYIQEAQKRLGLFRQYYSRVYRLAKDFQSVAFLPLMKKVEGRIQGALEALSLARIFAREFLRVKTFSRFKESLGKISIKRHLPPRAYLFAKISSFPKIPFSAERALRKMNGQRQRLSSLWLSAKESLTEKIPDFIGRSMLRLRIQKPQIHWGSNFGKEFLSQKVAVLLPLIILLFAAVIFLAQENIQTLFKGSEFISKVNPILLAGKIIPALAEKDLEAVLDQIPESVAEKEEPSENPLPGSPTFEPSAPKEETNLPLHPSPTRPPASPGGAPKAGPLLTAQPFEMDMPERDMDVDRTPSPAATSRKEEPIASPAPFAVADKNSPLKPEREKPIRADKPVLIHSFASKQIRPGGRWKVYLKASHATMDMKYIFITVEMGGSHLNVIQVNEKNQRFFSGYITLDTRGVNTSMGFVNLTLNVSLEDDAGRFSQSVTFPLSLERNAIREEPPPGMFEEQELGIVMIDFQSLLNQRYGG